MYNWRKMSQTEQAEVLQSRKLQKRPWHSPPHRSGNKTRYHITAACFEHKHIIGSSIDRMSKFEESFIDLADSHSEKLYSWALLPNHYHLLLKTDKIFKLIKALGRLHGCSSYNWNGEEGCRGRKVWCSSMETAIKSDAHFWGTVNYIFYNPIKHGYVKQWQDWPFSNAKAYLENVGREKAKKIWDKYDISQMGKDWDLD